MVLYSSIAKPAIWRFRPLWPVARNLDHISDLEKGWAHQLLYTFFYNNHAHRLRLEKLLCLEPSSRSSNGFLNHFRIQVAVSLLKPPERRFQN
jgi:hypothetical protein